MLIVLVTVFFGVTFTLMNPRPIFGALFSVVPERHHARTLAIMVRIAEFVPRWSASVLISMLTFGVLGVIIAAPLVAIAGIIHEEIYRKQYLPTVTDKDLGFLARSALLEKGTERR